MSEEQTKAEVRESLIAAFLAWRTGDAKGWVQLTRPELYGYFYGAGLLSEGSTNGNTEKEFRGWVDAGLKSTMTPSHIEVRLAGKDAAIATFYIQGSETWGGGSTIEGTWRATAVFAREDGKWKWLHYHFSPLTTTQIERKA